MSCNVYNELHRRCESMRKEMSHFMRYKPGNWQIDPCTRGFVNDTQTEILNIAAEIDAHPYRCSTCKQSLANR
jgi:hypothetical protein